MTRASERVRVFFISPTLPKKEEFLKNTLVGKCDLWYNNKIYSFFMKNLFHFDSEKEGGKYIHFSAEAPHGEIPREKFGNLEVVPWVKEHLASLKKEIESYENIDRAKTVTLLSEIKDVNWKKDTPAESAKYVFALQSALHLLGHGEKVGQIDALWGRKSAAGLLEFQQKWNTDHPDDKIKEDGMPGPESVGRILQSLGVLPEGAVGAPNTPQAGSPEQIPAPTEAPESAPASTEAPAPTQKYDIRHSYVTPEETPAPTEAPRGELASPEALVDSEGFPNPEKIEFGAKETGEEYSSQEKQWAKEHFETERLTAKLINEKLETFLEWSKSKYTFSEKDVSAFRQELQKQIAFYKANALDLAEGFKTGIAEISQSGNMSPQDFADQKADVILATVQSKINTTLEEAFSKWKRGTAFEELDRQLESTK